MLSSVLLFVLADEGSGGSIIPGCFAFLFSLGITCLVIYWMVKAKLPKTPLVAEKLTITTGVFFGRVKRMLIGKPQNADGHVLVVGGAGSGKSSCIAIPTLRDTWAAPALVVDIKGELLQKSQRPGAMVFNPLEQQGLGYDPFESLYGSQQVLGGIRQIAFTLVPMSPAETRDPFWIQGAQNLLCGHLLYAFKHKGSFLQAIRVMQSAPIETLLEVDCQDKDAALFLGQFVGMKQETLASIKGTLSNYILPFLGDEDIIWALSQQDVLTPDLLLEGHDVFLRIPEYKLESWKSLITLMVQQFLQHFEKRPEGSTVPILFLLDEAPRLGKMEAILHALATLRSKKITVCLIVQSLAQLDAIYGHDQRKVIADNCSYKAILQATDADTQKYFSQLVGTEEREKKTYSKKDISLLDHLMAPVGSEKGGHASPLDQGKSVSTTTEEKAIIKPEEFAYLKDIVLLSPHGFLRVEKVPYYLSESPALVHVQPTSMQPAHGGAPSLTAGNGHREPVSDASPKPRKATSVPSHEPAVRDVAAPPTSQDGSQGEPFAPSAYVKRRQLEQAKAVQEPEPVRGFTPRDPRQDVQPLPAEGLSPSHQQDTSDKRYEAALATLAHYAPAGTPLAMIALQFATKLPPEKQTDFLSWWQQHQNGR